MPIQVIPSQDIAIPPAPALGYTAGDVGFSVPPSSLTYTNSASTFTLLVNGTFRVVIAGVEYTVTNASKAVAWGSLAEGPNFFYYTVTGGALTLTHSTALWTLGPTIAPVAVIYWQAGAVNAPLGGIGYECHSVTMDWGTHDYLHKTRGTAYTDGGGLSGYTVNTSAGNITIANADLSYGISTINMMDEDIALSCTGVAEPASLPAYYRDSSGNWRRTTTTYGIVLNGAVPRYNLIGTGLADVTDARWFAIWIYATNLQDDPIVVIPGQRLDTSLSDATANNTIASLSMGTLFTTEFKVLYRLIYRYDTAAPFTITNSDGGTRVVIQDVQDLRSAASGGGAAVPAADHGSLAGLADDDHLQYLPVTGSRSLTANLDFSGVAARFTADMSTATLANRFAMQTNVADSNMGLFLLPNGTGTAASVLGFNKSDPTNSNWIRLQMTSTEARIDSGLSGTGYSGSSTYMPLSLYTSNTLRYTIGTDGRMTFSVPDSASPMWLFSGTTKGVRIISNSGGSTIEGVDNTGTGSYQPLYINGSTIIIQAGGTDYFGVESDGRLYGKALHNSGTVTGTTKQYFASGTYTPSYTNVSNTTAGTPGLCQWTRVGNVVTVSGRINLTVTNANASTNVGLSLPIASNFTNSNQCNGTFISALVTTAINGGTITGDSTNDRADILFRSGATTGAQNFSFTFQYEIL